MPKAMPNGNYSRFAFLLLCISAVMGLGNYWKFAEYSLKFRGAFLAAYILAVLVIGIPLLILEFAAGRKYRSGIEALFSKARQLGSFGWFVMMSTLLIAVYYSIQLSWNVIYFFTSFGAPWKENPSSYFANNVLQLSPEISQIGTIALPVFISLLLAWVAIFFIIRKGAKTMKAASWILLPACIILIISFLMMLLPSKGSLSGISHLLDISLSSFYSIELWKQAFVQALMSLGLAVGLLAFLSSKNKGGFILGDSVIIALFKIIFTILIGFVIFGSLGILSENKGASIEDMKIDYRNSNFRLFPEFIGLVSYPTLAGLVLFLSFSIISLLASSFTAGFVCSSLSKKFNADCQKIAIMLCGAGFLLGIIFTTKAGFYFLDLLEHFVYNYSILAMALVQCVLAGWLLKKGEIADYISKNSRIKIGNFWAKIIRSVVPLILAALIILLLKDDIASLYNGYPLMFVLGAAALVAVPLIVFLVL